MLRRMIALVLLLAAVLQGPAPTYAATAPSSVPGCDIQVLAGGSPCEECCTQTPMSSCAVQCPLPMGPAVPMTSVTAVPAALRGIVIPDDGIAPFVDHDPPHPLRPPIV